MINGAQLHRRAVRREATSGVVECGPTGTIVSVEDSIAELFEVSPEEMYGRTFIDFVMSEAEPFLNEIRARLRDEAGGMYLLRRSEEPTLACVAWAYRALADGGRYTLRFWEGGAAAEKHLPQISLRTKA